MILPFACATAAMSWPRSPSRRAVSRSSSSAGRTGRGSSPRARARPRVPWRSTRFLRLGDLLRLDAADLLLHLGDRSLSCDFRPSRPWRTRDKRRSSPLVRRATTGSSLRARRSMGRVPFSPSRSASSRACRAASSSRLFSMMKVGPRLGIVEADQDLARLARDRRPGH